MDEEFARRQAARFRAAKLLVAGWLVLLLVAILTFVLAPTYQRWAVGLFVGLILAGYPLLDYFQHADHLAHIPPPAEPLTKFDLECLVHSHKAYCVYLRNFRPEGDLASVPIRVRDEFASEPLLRRGARLAPVSTSAVEYALSAVLSRIKLIAIENPSGNVLPVIDYVKCGRHRWEDVLDIAARNAHLIVMACDEDSSGLRYELTWLRQNCALRKTWVILADEFRPTILQLVPDLSELALSVTTCRGPLRYLTSLVLPHEVSLHLPEKSAALPAGSAKSDA